MSTYHLLRYCSLQGNEAARVIVGPANDDGTNPAAMNMHGDEWWPNTLNADACIFTADEILEQVARRRASLEADLAEIVALQESIEAETAVLDAAGVDTRTVRPKSDIWNQMEMERKAWAEFRETGNAKAIRSLSGWS